MRVNHTGELAAQALYHGQAFLARSERTRELLLQAARDESDHLAWCETRLQELESRARACSIRSGTPARSPSARWRRSLGDRASLGFVAETERQVEGHLDEHLARLPASDVRSRAILETMRTDEIAHGATATSGRSGAELAGAGARAHAPHRARHDGHCVLDLSCSSNTSRAALAVLQAYV